MQVSRRFSAMSLAATVTAFLAGPAAFAQPVQPSAAPAAAAVAADAGLVMAPHPWEIWMQAAHSPVKHRMEQLNVIVSGLMALIVAFVAVLLVYVLWRYNHKRHPVASKISHHTWLEVAWTLAPALILVAIALPSFSLIFYEDRARDADMTLKVTGHQWYWEYTYPDQGNLDFVSNIVPQDQLKPGQLRLLTVDNQLVLPVGKNIRILTTSADVIHSFFIPSLGVQRYAIPGRTIETWVRIDQPGTYYGECNQICGTNHSAMPISVRAVTPGQFQAWLTTAKTRFSSNAEPRVYADLRH